MEHGAERADLEPEPALVADGGVAVAVEAEHPELGPRFGWRRRKHRRLAARLSGRHRERSLRIVRGLGRGGACGRPVVGVSAHGLP